MLHPFPAEHIRVDCSHDEEAHHKFRRPLQTRNTTPNITSNITPNATVPRKSRQEMVRQINSIEEFDMAINEAPVVVIDFFATWCGPCIAIAPKLEDWERRLLATGQKISFGKVDVDQLTELARREGVTAMPTFFIYRQGKLVRTVIGANPPALQGAVEEYLSLVA